MQRTSTPRKVGGSVDYLRTKGKDTGTRVEDLFGSLDIGERDREDVVEDGSEEVRDTGKRRTSAQRRWRVFEVRPSRNKYPQRTRTRARSEVHHELFTIYLLVKVQERARDSRDFK